MIFLGRTVCGGRNILDYTSTNVRDITYAKVQSGIYDEVYASRDVGRDYTPTIPVSWNYDTALHARFQESINAGNVDFILNQLSSMKIKRRISGTFDWTTLFETPIKDVEDLTFERFDRYCRSGTEYEYSLVPVINDAEGEGKIATVLSEFDGVFITEKEQAFGTFLEVDIQSQKNRPNSVVNTIDRKYPYVVSNGQNNYYTGSASGVFIEFDYDACQFKVKESWQYRDGFMEFLQNGKPKILKYGDGRMWLMAVIDNPNESASEHPDKVVTTFNWAEVGDCDSGSELYNNNFIDIDPNRW